LDDSRENVDQDGLGGSGEPKDPAEIRGEYLMSRCTLKIRRYDLVEAWQRADGVAVNIENVGTALCSISMQFGNIPSQVEMGTVEWPGAVAGTKSAHQILKCSAESPLEGVPDHPILKTPVQADKATRIRAIQPWQSYQP
jgi:hypothetical protein